MENQRFDRQLRAMLMILEHDYAGIALNPEPVDSRYYVQATGMAWKEGTLDGLTFLRYGSQMLATTQDRSLRLHLTDSAYAPWRPGFDVRRVGDDLFVTGVQEEQRLQPGDRIVHLNAIPAGVHRKQFQKNFLYAQEPEREMWGNVLKMTKHMLVEHPDGSREDMLLRQFQRARPHIRPTVTELEPGVVLLNAGDMRQGEELEQLVSENRHLLDTARKLIIDLRQCNAGAESDFLPLVPYVLNGAKTMSQAAGTQTLCTLYTEDNCRRLAELLAPYADIPEAKQELERLEQRKGTGWAEETVDLWEGVPEVISPRGAETVLLTDSFCEGAAESFLLLAKKEGRAKLVGRATRGSLDYADMISVRLSDSVVFTYPMTITQEAKNGKGFLGKGVLPDVVIPFTKEECVEDRILMKAR